MKFLSVLFIWILSMIGSNKFFAQVQKQFTQRTSSQALPSYIKPNTQNKIYNLRGDFQMIGNTNLTLEDYNNISGNGNENMKYVDIDNDGTTINSSSAYLNLPDDGCTEIVYAGLYWSGRANTGNMSFNATGTVQGNPVTSTATQTLNHTHNGTNNLDETTVVININNTNPNDVYATQLVRIGNKQFEFTIRNNSTVFVRERTGNGSWSAFVQRAVTVTNSTTTNTPIISYGNYNYGTPTDGPKSSWSGDTFYSSTRTRTFTQTASFTRSITKVTTTTGYKTFLLNTPITLLHNGQTYTISELRVYFKSIETKNFTETGTATRTITESQNRSWVGGFFGSWGPWDDNSTFNNPNYNHGTATNNENSVSGTYVYNATLSDFRNPTNNFVTIQGPETTTTTTNVSYNQTLAKNKIKIKKGNGAYQTFTANTSDIHYPSGTYSDIYAAYVDVTEYVRNNGLGNYFVADLATSTGNGGGTGYFGGWGMVVVYANPNMKWRDVTIFDGYAHVAASNNETTSHNIAISGFQAAQKGDVNVSVGVMAGEGDVDINGDFFRIQRRNTNNYENLGNSGGTGGAFFRSAVETGGNVRQPNLVNNTGIDIQRIEIPNQQQNTQNYIINNNQTSTTFQYGSNQDTYVIYSLAFAVDAYVPNAQNENTVLSIYNPSTNESFTPSSPGFENRLINLQPKDQVTLSASLYNYGGVDNERVVGPLLGNSTTNRDRVQLNINIAPSTFLKTATVTTNQTGINDILSTDALENNSAYTHFGNIVWVSPDGSQTVPVAPQTSSNLNLQEEIAGGRIVWKPKDIPRQNESSSNRAPMATLTYVLEVIDDCAVLRSSENNCIMDTTISATNIGFGENSNSPMKDGFLIGYSDPDCGQPVPQYGTTELKVNPNSAFYENNCGSFQVSTEVYLEHFCSAPTFYQWDYIADFYPPGTRFYRVKPNMSGYQSSQLTPYQNINLVFETTSEPGIEEEWLYAMLPGVSNNECFFNIHIVKKTIVSTPVINNQSPFCANIPFSWPLSLSSAGQQNGLSIQVFSNSNGTNLLTSNHSISTTGLNTFYAREVKLNNLGEVICAGPLFSFSITVEGCPIPINPMIQTPLNRN